ncbi:hypothetical protein BDEG_24461 [Batrachochytrium dendrobatidis JEL423]|uniref:Uncharacterized protein n=1 Tax=Batrachochytrium dendrobatidis (strain JEL423) TaxID=403673 RepID=A0A177WN19_BATDL|nr:hypothetical protein BDEG_24461 [Batrachochytrium dendrobatidis JEL423]
MEIETHFDGELDSKGPLDDVSTLIAAFQARPGSLLGNTDSELITPLCDGWGGDQLQRMGLACCTCNKWDCWIQSTHHQIQE